MIISLAPLAPLTEVHTEPQVEKAVEISDDSQAGDANITASTQSMVPSPAVKAKNMQIQRASPKTIPICSYTKDFRWYGFALIWSHLFVVDDVWCVLISMSCRNTTSGDPHRLPPDSFHGARGACRATRAFHGWVAISTRIWTSQILIIYVLLTK